MRFAHILFYLAIVGYALGTLYYLLHVLRKRQSVGRLATLSTLVGFGLHSLSAIFQVSALGRPPLGTLSESLSFLAWAIALIYLVTEARYRNRVMGAFVLPIVLLTALAAATLPGRAADVRPALQGIGLWVHVALAVLGNAAFALTFCAGLMYLLQERQLKSRHLGRMHFRLPSLELLDSVSLRSLLAGFPLLTLALITGFMWAEHTRGTLFPFYGREAWSILSWFIFAGLLVARLWAGWRGRKAAILAIVGFCLVLFTLVGVSMVRRGPLL
jgi:cytochrome c-type biogenesis protein CcsB